MRRDSLLLGRGLRREEHYHTSWGHCGTNVSKFIYISVREANAHLVKYAAEY